MEGVEGAELGEGPAVLAVPELLAGPDDETGGCFLLRIVWFFEAYIELFLINLFSGKKMSDD